MKKLFCLFAALILSVTTNFAQTDISIQPVLSQYASSATPGVTPGVQYQVRRTINGAPDAYDQTKCKYTWTLTNGKEAYSNSTNPIKNGDQNLFITWNNINGSANAKVVVTSTPNNTCPLLSGSSSIQREINVPIQYFGPLSQVRLNGSPVSVGNLNCGTNAVTFSVPAPTTTYPVGASINYNWVITNGTITGGQGTNTIQVNPFLNQQVTAQVNAKRADNAYITNSAQATLNRPLPATPSLTTSVDVVCSGQTATATATASNATGYEWTSTGGVLVNGSQNTGVTGASVGISGSASGTYSVRAYSSSCQTYSNSIAKSPFFGSPTLQLMKYGTAGNGVTNTVYNVNTVSASTWYIVQTNEPSGSLAWNPNNASVNGYVSGPYEYRFYLNAGQSLTFSPLTATNSCGTATRYPTFTTSSGFRVTPNPATTEFQVEFDHVDYLEALPEQIDLFSEKSTKAVRSVKVKDTFDKKAFKNNNAIDFDVKDLPRGTYYLHVIDSKKKDKEVEAIRVVLE